MLALICSGDRTAARSLPIEREDGSSCHVALVTEAVGYWFMGAATRFRDDEGSPKEAARGDYSCRTYSIAEPSWATNSDLTQRPRSSNHWSILMAPEEL